MFNRHGLLLLLLSLPCAVLPLRGAAASTITVTPAADTTLLQSAPDFNMGAELHIASGTTGPMGERTLNRGLLRFNLESIPAGSIIQSVALRLTVTFVPGRDGGGGPVNSTFALHRMNRAWGEGTKLGFRGEFATAGEATWNHAFAPGSNVPGTTWSTPGTAAPVDFERDPSATQWIAGVGQYSFKSTDALIADVQRWVDDPSANHGWLLITQEESRAKTARRFASREAPENAPALEVMFVPPTPPRIENVRRLRTSLLFEFQTESDSSYSVEYRDNAAEGFWSVLTNIPPRSTAARISIAAPITGKQRYFRITQ